MKLVKESLNEYLSVEDVYGDDPIERDPDIIKKVYGWKIEGLLGLAGYNDIKIERIESINDKFVYHVIVFLNDDPSFKIAEMNIEITENEEFVIKYFKRYVGDHKTFKKKNLGKLLYQDQIISTLKKLLILI